jgi:PTS system mannose-specific IID component
MPLGLRIVVFLRSLSLQASWNSQRMQNLGLLVTMIPWLRRQPRLLERDRAFCRRYFEFFNTNPYLANYLIGGLLRLEAERDSGNSLPPGQTATFRNSLAQAFASLGDQLFWLGVKPALTMGICLLALHGHVAAVLLVVGCFAIGQLWLRWRSLGLGYRMGLDIVDLLDQPLWHRWIAWTKRAGMVLTGMLTGCYLVRVMGFTERSDQGLLWAGVVLGMGLPVILRRRFPGEVLLLVALVIAFVLSFAI